jgi:glypican 4 (K-glypican)
LYSDYVYVLLNKAQREFHDMFTRTYGIMYQKNAEVFQEYFKELKVYYDKGATNPALSTTTFFSTLYQKMFQVEKKGWTIFFQNRDILLYIHAC